MGEAKEKSIRYELLLSREGKDVAVVPLDRESFRVGRAPTNDLAIPDPKVSRHQFELLLTPGGVRLLDRSGKGTVINGESAGEAELAPGACVVCGSLSLVLRANENDSGGDHTRSGSGTEVLDGEPATSCERLVLTGRKGEHALRVQLENGTVGLGKDPSNDVVVREPYISSFHCRFFQKPDGWYVSDLQSTNGTFINGVRVSEARLQVGVTLTVGRLDFQVGVDTQMGDWPGFGAIYSQDPAMKPVFALIQRAAATDQPVLITGESGTGKELVARELHRLSVRSRRRLVPLNCSAIPRDLMESELFGYEKGAFTGALAARAGLFEEADGGTLFLDEIGELPLDLQPKLLRVLENGEVRRVGGSEPLRVDVRLLSATHRNLSRAVGQGTFREDLYYRLCVIPIHLPPLRERPRDIPLLAKVFLEQTTRDVGPRRLSAAAMDRLKEYRFPGNVRELRHAITRAAILCPRDIIGPEHLVFNPPTLADRVAESLMYRKGMTLREVEVQVIREAIAAYEGNVGLAARSLGIARSTLWDKMARYHIHVPNCLDRSSGSADGR
jgi:transcriptional regulator with AAA-type ATPase domain/pSer/pThr/pTyr-binding forkhead associated (FHA) protein